MEQQSFSHRMYSDYINEVETSGILKAKIGNGINNDKSLKASLTKSRYRAIKEFRACHKDIVKLFDEINKVEDEMSGDIRNISDRYETYKGVWDIIFDHFNLQLSKIFQYASESLIGSFNKKVKRIDNFTICLFGRTKAGKSTTMEALTEGNGDAIGRGRQNTTLDVKEYEWRELLIIDTPGIDAMDKKDQLESMALSYADESDLIMFLLPHQIEEGDFDKFSRFYKQNKPILLLLNIKKEIGEKDSREYGMFLKHNDDIFEEGKIAGYTERINDFMLSKLKVEEGLIPVLPVHSASAFMALQEDNKKVKNKLRECSNFQTLEDQLIKEISEYGELYRIKNPHDTVELFAKKIVDEFRLFKDMLEQQKAVFEKNILKFSDVKAEILRKKNKNFGDKIGAYFNSKRATVTSLVERLFDEKDENNRKKILENFIPARDIKNKSGAAQKAIMKIIEKEIDDFFKMFAADMATIDFEAGKSKIFTKTNMDMANIRATENAADIMGGVGLASGLILSLGTVIVVSEIGIFGASGTLFTIGSANIWNPVGWGLLGTSVLAAIAGGILKKKHAKKIATAKKETRDKISGKLLESQRKFLNEMNQWVNKILKDLENSHIEVMKKYVEYSEKHITKCENLFSDLERVNTKSRRKKFREMVRCLQGNNKFKIKDVTERDNIIEIKIPNQNLSNKEYTEKVLSRVEEKPVKINGGAR